jgi:hypothetical protein
MGPGGTGLTWKLETCWFWLSAEFWEHANESATTATLKAGRIAQENLTLGILTKGNIETPAAELFIF